jgi:hypothetical protein
MTRTRGRDRVRIVWDGAVTFQVHNFALGGGISVYWVAELTVSSSVLPRRALEHQAIAFRASYSAMSEVKSRTSWITSPVF